MSSSEQGPPEGWAEVRDDWHEAVNMTAAQLEEWLGTEASREVGQSDDGGESTGHRSGRRIVEILRKRVAEHTDDDVEHMRTVVGYVRRHLAQRPDGDRDEIDRSRWAASLRNWGHDPLA